MPHADKERILAAAPDYAAQLSQRRQISAVYEGAQDGWYRAAFTISEDDAPALFLRVSTRDDVLAERMVKRFAGCVPHLLTLFYTLPFERMLPPDAVERQEALDTVLPGSPALCGLGGREHAAVVSIGDGEAAYQLLLRMPDASLAWGWALTADAADAGLASKITAMLGGIGL